MGDAFWIVVAAVAVSVLVVPATVVALFARQVFPHRPYTTIALAILGFVVFPVAPLAWGMALWLQLDGRRRARASASSVGPSAKGEWARLARRATAAAGRYDSSVATMSDGPLRSRLRGLVSEVRASVAEAELLAGEGTRLDRACGDVQRALTQSRRASRTTVATDARLALLAQEDSLRRLRSTRVTVLDRLVTLVARLDQIAAHATELSLGTTDAAAADELSQHVEALRLAVADLDRLTVPSLAR